MLSEYEARLLAQLPTAEESIDVLNDQALTAAEKLVERLQKHGFSEDDANEFIFDLEEMMIRVAQARIVESMLIAKDNYEAIKAGTYTVSSK